MYAGQVNHYIAYYLLFANMNLEETKTKMQKVLGVLQSDLATIRTGRATPSLVEHVVVSVYGGTQRLKIMEVGTIGTLDPQTLIITPFDGSITGEIQKGIMEANIGLTPSADGNIIRITIPPLSQERRVELIKLMKQKLENGRIMIRQVRQDARNVIRKQHLDKEISEEQMYRTDQETQKVTDGIMLLVDEMGKKKEEELMQI